MLPAALAQGARNLAQTGLLLAGMAALLTAVGWGLAGPDGAFLTLGAGIGFLLIAPELSGRLTMQALGARRLVRDEASLVFRVRDAICRRAGLAPPPALFYLPHRLPQAFTIGQRPETAAICLSDGLLHSLGVRELAAVLAHEIAHILNRDLHVMMLADTIARMTRTMSLAGVLLLIVNGVIYVTEWAGGLAWWLPLVLIGGPTASALMQRALARTREFEADRAAARLTGDPLGLAAALTKLESRSEGLWERLIVGADGIEPSLLRTHPLGAVRVARLKALAADAPPLEDMPASDGGPLAPHLCAASRQPRLLWWWR